MSETAPTQTPPSDGAQKGKKPLRKKKIIGFESALIAALLLIGVVGLLNLMGWSPVSKSGGSSSSADMEIVVFDMLKFMEAQRNLMGSGDREDRMIFMRANNVLEETIRSIAGPDRLVMVKQALLAPNARIIDITDEVLKRLGLPEATGAGAAGVHLLTPQGRMLDEMEQDEERWAGAELRMEGGSAGGLLP